MPVTEITLSGGERLRVAGAPPAVEATILSAARGAIMELAWLTDADSGQRVAVNPDHVLMLRAFDPVPVDSEPSGDAATPGEQS